MPLTIRERRAQISCDRVGSLRYPICVTGMGRSGTSLTTALIGLLGVYLGPEERMLNPVENDNARGYWEQRELCGINEEVLGSFGGTWERPPSLRAHWERSPSLDNARDRARAVLAEMFGGTTVRWAWKDPRTAVTLPFWRELIGKMDYVICVRHPADVASSLAIRGSHDLDFEGAIVLWYRYMRAALDNTRGSRRLILNYEDYFLQPDRQIERLTRFVCGPEADPTDELRERLGRFVEPELWHNRDPGDGLESVRAVSPEAADLYERLTPPEPARRAASRSTGADLSLFGGLSIAQISWFALILCSVVAVTDALDSRVILIPLLVTGPLCGLLTGRWTRTAIAGIWAVVLAVLLCVPDEIWGTSTQLSYLGTVVAAALLSTSAATAIEKSH
ncbi:MAG TPA: sulfotransferase [Solirubrobacteraceae bacterium]